MMVFVLCLRTVPSRLAALHYNTLLKFRIYWKGFKKFISDNVQKTLKINSIGVSVALQNCWKHLDCAISLLRVLQIKDLSTVNSGIVLDKYLNSWKEIRYLSVLLINLRYKQFAWQLALLHMPSEKLPYHYFDFFLKLLKSILCNA